MYVKRCRKQTEDRSARAIILKEALVKLKDLMPMEEEQEEEKKKKKKKKW
jgi:hypothetical protein